MLNKNFTPFPEIITGRLTLRQLSINDQEDIFQLRSDATVNQYLGRQPAKTIEDAANFIYKVNDNIKLNNSLYWAITIATSNTLVGTICLYDFSAENNSCEIGYELKPEFQGKGLMKEASQAVLDFAFHTLMIEKITAVTHRDNINSTRLLTGFNFLRSETVDMENPELDIYTLIKQHVK